VSVFVLIANRSKIYGDHLFLSCSLTWITHPEACALFDAATHTLYFYVALTPGLAPFQGASPRMVKESDFATLTAWLAEPHVGRFYQKTPVTLEEVALEYGPLVRGEERTICHLAISGGVPFAYLQCYRPAADHAGALPSPRHRLVKSANPRASLPKRCHCLDVQC
jgi:hypothetical protein